MDFFNIRFLVSQIEVSQIDRKLAVTTITGMGAFLSRF